MNRLFITIAVFPLGLLTSCSTTRPKESVSVAKVVPAPAYFKVDSTTAGSISGRIRFTGRKPVKKLVDMSEDPACVEAHHGKAYEDTVVINSNGTLANVFICIKSGLAGKTFAVPTTAVTIDQHGCWFDPRVMGIQVGQKLEVTNSDPVTHNIHPQAQINREWNHSQGQGDAPLARKFLKPEVMIRVKCNIHSWMHAFIGVVDHPYYAVSGSDGSFKLDNVPPGDYVLEAWQESYGTQELKVTVAPSAKVESVFTYKGE